jgi:hypothetical protein
MSLADKLYKRMKGGKGSADPDPEPDPEDPAEEDEGESEGEGKPKDDSGGADGRALAAAIKRGDGGAIEELVRRICDY